MRFSTEYIIDIVITVVVTILLLYGYKLMLKRYRKGEPSQNYAVLHSLTNTKVKGEVRLFFELPEKDTVRFFITDASNREVEVFKDEEMPVGNYPVIFDSTRYSDGEYEYHLITRNQRIRKSFTISNNS